MGKVKSFIENLFRREKEALPIHVIDEYSQNYVLRTRMRQVGIRHDQKVIADIDRIRLEKPKTGNYKGEYVAKFCPTDMIRVRETLSEGDDQSMPSEVRIGFRIPKNTKPGLYQLRNVLLHANGRITVSGTEKTKLVRVR